MKTLLVLMSCLMCSTCLMASLVTNESVLFCSKPSFESYSLTIYQNAEQTDCTTILFDRDYTDLIFRGGSLDNGSDWYFCDYKDELSDATTTLFPLFNQVDDRFTIGFGEFYLGVNTSVGFLGPGDVERKAYGWAHMKNTQCGLQLLGSVVAYDEPGIVIGTTMTIPEPSTLMLIFFGIAWLPLWMRIKARAVSG